MYTAITINISGIHPKYYHQLKKQYGSAKDLLEKTDQFYKTLNLPDSVRRKLQRPDYKKVDETLHWAKKNQISLLSELDKDYPAKLKELPCYPPLLYVKGNTKALTKPGISIVGSRNASFYGLENTKTFAYDLAKSGYNIISGLAIGVDYTAHKACLEAEQDSVAVIGLGIDNITPIQNRHLAKLIANQGCIVSEMPIRTPYQKQCFPRRNRLISALGIATLITEAAISSGTLVTAQYSTDLHRPIMAIPGRIDQPQASGCHKLIQEGAHLVTSSSDCQDILMSSS